MFAYNAGGVTDRSGEIIAQGTVGAARTQAEMYNQLGNNIGNALAAIGGMYGEFQDKKQGSLALDKAMGMAADEGLVTYDTLEKFQNLPWRQKKPVFDLVTATVVPIAANRQKVEDQARVWSEYRGSGGGMPASAAANRYGYVYQGP